MNIEVDPYLIHFNEGHAAALRVIGILKEAANVIGASEYVKRALELGKVQAAVTMLSQEMGNRAVPIYFIEVSIEDIQKVTEHLTEENIDQALHMLESFDSGVIKASINARAMAEAIRLFKLAEKYAVGQGLPSLFTPNTTFYLSKATEDYLGIQKVLAEKGVESNRIYLEAVARVNKFLE